MPGGPCPLTPSPGPLPSGPVRGPAEAAAATGSGRADGGHASRGRVKYDSISGAGDDVNGKSTSFDFGPGSACRSRARAARAFPTRGRPPDSGHIPGFRCVATRRPAAPATIDQVVRTRFHPSPTARAATRLRTAVVVRSNRVIPSALITARTHLAMKISPASVRPSTTCGYDHAVTPSRVLPVDQNDGGCRRYIAHISRAVLESADRRAPPRRREKLQPLITAKIECHIVR